MLYADYDNPATMARESYRDGELRALVTAQVLCLKMRPERFAKSPPWQPGHVAGDHAAMPVWCMTL